VPDREQGKVRKAARRGESIPEGWMLDAEGRSTTDPVEALKGVVCQSEDQKDRVSQ
jgi:LDH2 family malate/lactate/ureidoglycolate dehydrogenase